MSKTNTIITIGRQFGSGGKEIGQKWRTEKMDEMLDGVKQRCFPLLILNIHWKF